VARPAFFGNPGSIALLLTQQRNEAIPCQVQQLKEANEYEKWKYNRKAIYDSFDGDQWFGECDDYGGLPINFRT
ncbi:MAG: hypothetical protein ABIV21_01555, partial [Pyrinomonadaceae bacterium]